MKSYYLEAIAELAESCNDIATLDLIYQILRKKMAQQEAAKATSATDA